MTDLSNWPALVLTAGLATRLRPLSTARAKAAMPIAGSAIVVRILRWLQAAGIRRVVLNLHHLPASVTSIVGDGSQLGIEVRYSWEATLLGSAGGPRRALPLLDADRFFVINGDTLTDCSLSAVAARHLAAGARVTMAVVAGDVARYGGVIVDRGGLVHGFGVKAPHTRAAAGPNPEEAAKPLTPTSGAAASPTSAGGASPTRRAAPSPELRALHFIGVQAVDAGVFASLPDDRPSETVRSLYPQLIAEQPGAVVAYESTAEFLDVGTPRDYFDTVARMAAREGRVLDVGVDCQISPSARIDRTILWDRVVIGEHAQLRGCIVADGVHVPPGAVHTACVLVNGPAGLTVSPF